jgi:sec-independent protein translocase protein TatA
MQLLAGLGPLGPLELGLILVIVVLIFGVGRLPEVGGAIGKSVREFRKATKDDEHAGADSTTANSAITSPGGSTDATGATSVEMAPPAAAGAASDTMFCSECGARNARSAKFCAECGHAIAAAVR